MHTPEFLAAILVPVKSPAPAQPFRFGLPLRQGFLGRDADVSLLDGSIEIPIATEPLAHWADGSLRAISIRFAAPALTAPKSYTLRLNERRTKDDTSIKHPPADTGMPSLIMKLPPEYLCATGAFGSILPASATPLSSVLDARVLSDLRRSVWEQAASNTMPLDYDRGLHEYFYYDVFHAAYLQYLRLGETDLFSFAYAAARVYREKMVLHTGPRKGFPMVHPSTAPPEYLRMVWADMRCMYIEGLLDDYQLTGDARSFEVAREMADAYVKEIPLQGRHLRTNERNPGWSLLELCAFHEFTREQIYLDTATFLVNDILGWQHPTGGWLRIYEDLGECPHGCFGGQPFMHAILLEGLIRYHRLTKESRIEQALIKAIDWLLTPAAGWRPDSSCWIYLPGCFTAAQRNANHFDNFNLPLLIAHCLGYGYQLTGKETYKTAATGAFNSGAAKAGVPDGKLFAQQYRNSPRCLAYLTDKPGVHCA